MIFAKSRLILKGNELLVVITVEYAEGNLVPKSFPVEFVIDVKKLKSIELYLNRRRR